MYNLFILLLLFFQENIKFRIIFAHYFRYQDLFIHFLLPHFVIFVHVLVDELDVHIYLAKVRNWHSYTFFFISFYNFGKQKRRKEEKSGPKGLERLKDKVLF